MNYVIIHVIVEWAGKVAPHPTLMTHTVFGITHTQQRWRNIGFKEILTPNFTTLKRWICGGKFLMNTKTDFLDLNAQNDGKWTWYQLERGLNARGIGGQVNTIGEIQSLIS